MQLLERFYDTIAPPGTPVEVRGVRVVRVVCVWCVQCVLLHAVCRCVLHCV